jgi:mRNA-degrading endonuclease RelE of RelBE toxin-antitoxin system
MGNLPPIRMSNDVSAFIRTLHPILKKRIHAALQEIRTDPACGKALQNELEGYRSLRVGNFRVVYRSGDHNEIEVVVVGPRRTIYEETVRLIARKE